VKILTAVHSTHHYRPLWSGNFCVCRPHTDWVILLKTRGSLNYGTPPLLDSPAAFDMYRAA